MGCQNGKPADINSNGSVRISYSPPGSSCDEIVPSGRELDIASTTMRSHNNFTRFRYRISEYAAPKINKRKSDGQTPLTSAIHRNDIEGVRKLLLHPVVDINYPEEQLYCGHWVEYYPPLIVAIMCENIDIVQLLLLSGASVNVKDSQGFSALYHASKLGNKDIVSLLLSHAPNLPPTSVRDTCTIFDPLWIACCYNHMDVSELLIKAGCPVDGSDDNRAIPLDAALDNKNEALCLLLLQNGCNISERLFSKACSYGCYEVLRTMIDRTKHVRALTELRERTVLLALWLVNSEIRYVKVAYYNDVEKRKHKVTKLLQDNVNLIHFLCENGCDLEINDAVEKTVLYRCWELENIPAGIVLLKHGASLDLSDPDLYIRRFGDVASEIFNFYRTFISPHLPETVLRVQAGIKPSEEVVSLQGLCRFTIRNSMKSCREDYSSTIIGIKTLNLPRTLENYLCYREINEMDSKYYDMSFQKSPYYNSDFRSNCW